MREVRYGVALRGGVAWACAFALLASACGKARVDASDAVGGAESAGTGASSAAGSGAAGSTSGGSGAASGVGGDAGEGGAISGWVPAELRRLTTSEYTATIGDVLGTSQKPNLLGFSTQVDGFDNNAAANGVSDPLFFRYLETAESLADEVFASVPLRSVIVSCAQADDAACVRQIVTQAGLRLFRRPLLEGEIASYQKAYARARTRSLSHEDAVKEVLTALLVSAQFVYRMELTPSAADTAPLDQYALATRLSYLLWSSAPDAQLLGAAQSQALTEDAQLTAAVARLLDDPKSVRFVQSFAGQWLGLRNVLSASFNPLEVPGWSPELANAASNELQSFFSELLGSGQDWHGFLDSRVHFVTPQLAAVYGLPASTGRVMQSTGERQGFLGMVGFLASTSTPLRSEPSQRGAWIARQLLCVTLPDSPADMPKFADFDDEIRHYLNGMSAECVTCHQQIDSFGLALENYDAIGRYRTLYPDRAEPIDSLVTLPPTAGSASASGITSVSDALAKSPSFTNCTVQKLSTYASGRAFGDSERPQVQALAEQWRSGPLTLRDLISKLVLSPAFRGQSNGGTP